ncbi:hypothetical protein [Synechococcus phage S-H68]|jgi:hypothetical protein|nr:hypothetical protein [Synechococcus phage S-H68]
MSHRFDQIKPEHYITERQCQEMIDKAIDKHNKTATLISACIGSVLLFFYAQGLLIVVGLWK